MKIAEGCETTLLDAEFERPLVSAQALHQILGQMLAILYPEIERLSVSVDYAW